MPSSGPTRALHDTCKQHIHTHIPESPTPALLQPQWTQAIYKHIEYGELLGETPTHLTMLILVIGIQHTIEVKVGHPAWLHDYNLDNTCCLDSSKSMKEVTSLPTCSKPLCPRLAHTLFSGLFLMSLSLWHLPLPCFSHVCCNL